MRIYIILIIVAGTLYFSRNYVAGFLLNAFGKTKKTKNLPDLSFENVGVFSPRGVSRNFILSLDIEEIGDGTAKITVSGVAKKKLPDIV